MVALGEEEERGERKNESFRKMHEEDKSLGTEPSGRLMQWCPTMDLLAFVSGENHVVVHRLSWAKLLTVSENTSKVTALAWSPDGKTLAFGYEDGTITLYDIEASEVTASFSSSHNSEVTTLQWAAMDVSDKSTGAEMFQDRASRFMPALIDGTKEGARTIRNAGEVTLLLSGDAEGVVCLRFLGTFCVGKIHIAIPCGENEDNIYGVRIKNICASSDLSAIAVQVESTGEVCSEMRSSDASEVLTAPDTQAGIAGTGYLLVLNTEILSGNAAQLVQISSQARTLECMIESLQTSLKSIQSQWKDAWEHMAGRVAALEKAVRAHGSCGTPEGELLTSVASGAASPALQNFLSGTREQGLRRWERAMDSGCAHIRQQVTTKMLPTLEGIVFHAGELKGLSMWDELFGEVGLRAGAVEALVAEGSRCLQGFQQLLGAAHAFQRGMGQLCLWLERLAGRVLSDSGTACIAADDALAVAKFVKAHLTSDRIAALLHEGGGAAGWGEEASANQGLMTSLREAGPGVGSAGLVGQVGKLRDAVEFALGETKCCVTSGIAVEATMRLHPPAAAAGGEGALSAALVGLGGEGGEGREGETPLFGVALSHSMAAGGLDLWLARVTRMEVEEEAQDDRGGVVCLELAVCLLGEDLEEAEGVQVRDVRFYSQSKVAAVTGPEAQGGEGAENGGGGGARLVLAPCDTLDWGLAQPVGEWQCVDVQALLQSESMALQIPYGLQSRSLPEAEPAGLAVNGARGLSCVLLQHPWRMSLFDMEDDEGDDDEGGDDDDEADEEEVDQSGEGIVEGKSTDMSDASLIEDSMDQS